MHLLLGQKYLFTIAWPSLFAGDPKVFFYLLLFGDFWEIPFSAISFLK